MKRTYRFIRRALFAAGIICLLNSAGLDQMYTSVGQMPPESVEQLFVWGWLLLIPQGLHWLRAELRKKVRR